MPPRLAMLQLVDAASADLAAVAIEVQGLVTRLMSKSVGEIDVSDALGQMLRIAEANRLVLPQEVMAFFKQLMFLDGICRSLDPDYELFAEGAGLLESSLQAA